MNSEFIYRQVRTEGISLPQACDVVSTVTTLLNFSENMGFGKQVFVQETVEKQVDIFFPPLGSGFYYVVEGQKPAALC